MNRAEELDALAAKAMTPGDEARCNYDAWLPAALRLRAKGYTFEAIYDWLKSQNERLPKLRSTFSANMSRRIHRITRELATREAVR